MVDLVGIMSRLLPRKVMLVGDLMVDTYTIGKVRRISPEAPVSVLQVEKEENRPGGSGNAILNLVSLGAEVVALGRVGNDFHGTQLVQALEREGVDVRGLFVQSDFQTPVKNRVIAGNQQIVRLDFEKVSILPEILEEQVIESLDLLLEGVDIVAISDYAKGFLSRTLLTELIERSNLRKIPVIVDPKGTDFSKYSGATIIKPNLSEAIGASGLTAEDSLENISAKLFRDTDIEVFFITRSEEGISLFFREGKRVDFPVKVREIRDVTGAGDTVLAMLTFAYANGLSLEEASQLSNISAGIAIERFGCARITLADLASRLLEEYPDNKIFLEEHLSTLQVAIQGKPVTMLSFPGNEGLTSAIFRSIRKLTENKKGPFVIHLSDSEPNRELVSLLASLREIDFIFLKSKSLDVLNKAIKPKVIYELKGDELLSIEFLETV